MSNCKMKIKRILYLGLDPANYPASPNDQLTHLPIIQIIPAPIAHISDVLLQFPLYTHVLITSKSTVSILIPSLLALGFAKQDWSNKTIAAVGKITAKQLKQHGLPPSIVAHEETAEGLITELEQLDLQNAHLFWPHSLLSRPILREWLSSMKIRTTECVLYDTKLARPESLPSLHDFDEIIFTSPSTVDAFLELFDHLPKDISLKAIGPITEQYLYLNCNSVKVQE